MLRSGPLAAGIGGEPRWLRARVARASAAVPGPLLPTARCCRPFNAPCRFAALRAARFPPARRRQLLVQLQEEQEQSEELAGQVASLQEELRHALATAALVTGEQPSMAG